MKALVFDKSKFDWETSKGFEKVDVPEPVLNEAVNPADANFVIIKVHYAGVCGSDRGVWYRQAFKDAILNTIDQEKKPYRIIGHEFFGEIYKVGSKVKSQYDITLGDFVSCECHVVCNQCYQCLNGQKEVCTNERILGISYDGCFAEYIKVPAHIVWKTNTSKIRPEVAAVQDPFGNAVHAATKTDVSGKSVAIFGLGPIGLFLTLVIRGLGAKYIIGIEPNPVAQEMARHLGIDYVIPLKPQIKEHPYAHNGAVTDEIKKITNGIGVDVTFEMAGFNSSVNNTIAAVRRGGDVIWFGVKNGQFVLDEDFNKIVMKGITIHSVAGRQLWKTWETTRALLENTENRIQEKVYNVILNEGKDTILSIDDYTPEAFEAKMLKHPKILIQF